MTAGFTSQFKRGRKRTGIALLLSEHFFLSNSQIATGLVWAMGLSLVLFLLLAQLIYLKQQVIEIKNRSHLLSFCFPTADLQNTCQSCRKGQLTNDTLVLNWGFDPVENQGAPTMRPLRGINRHLLTSLADLLNPRRKLKGVMDDREESERRKKKRSYRV